MSDEDDGDLPREEIAAALAGDTAAFHRFFHHYDPTVRWAVGLRVYRWPALVPVFEDIVQEVWLSLIRRDCKLLRYYEHDREVSFSRFLAFITTRLGWRLAKRYLRHAERELADLSEEPEKEGVDLMMRLVRHDFLEKLLELARERLDEIDLALLEGYYFQGEPIQQIAKRLGIAEDTAYQRHRRLRQKLAALADELLGEDSGGKTELVAMLVVTGSLLVGGDLGIPSPGVDRMPSAVEVLHE